MLGQCLGDASQHPAVLNLGDSGEQALDGVAARPAMRIKRGQFPGNSIVLMQSFPSYIFRVGYSEFAIDTAMAREIFVRR